VTLERADPISRVALSEHGLAIFTGGYEKVSMFCDFTKSEVGDGSRVAGASQRGLSQRRHFTVCFVCLFVNLFFSFLQLVTQNNNSSPNVKMLRCFLSFRVCLMKLQFFVVVFLVMNFFFLHKRFTGTSQTKKRMENLQ